MMSLETIIGQNNHTVSLLKAQDFSNAVLASTEALKRQQAMVHAHPNRAVDETFTDELDQCVLCSSNNNDERADHDDNNNIDGSDTNAATFIYDQGIRIPDALANQDSVAAILIFNAALAYQMCAGKVPDQHKSSQLLSKAKSLYELAFKLHPTKHNALFQFVIMNNVGVIERDLGNEEASKTYFDHLWKFWMVVVALNQECGLRHMRGFLSNVLGEPGDMAAAA